MIIQVDNKIICALDMNNIGNAKRLIIDLYEDIQIFKVGLEYFINNGDSGMNAIGCIAMHNNNYAAADLVGSYLIVPEIFLDLKFHDIPKTVHGAVSGLHAYHHHHKITMTTVHAAGGIEMMSAAVEAADNKFEIIAVTELTSIAYTRGTSKIVLQRTEDALKAGAAGIVCSAEEVKKVRLAFGNDFKIIVPGIRAAGADKHDQKRVGLPNQAMTDGATYLVIGRPITQALDPKAAAKEFINSFND